jgi:uncharacterized protein (TIGR03437 family)
MLGRSSLALVCIAGSVAFGQAPQFTSASVVSAASFAQPVAPGALVSIFGTNLAAVTGSAPGQPLPIKLGGTSVTVNGVAAPLLFVSPTQIDLETPSATQICYGCSSFPTAAFVVTTAAGSSDSVPVPISLSAPAAFTVDGSGCGRAAADNVALNYSVTPNSASNSAAPGDYVAIFGTGYGLVYFPPPDGSSDSKPQQLEQGVGVTLGYNNPPTPYILPNYEGLAPGLVGVDQVNFQIPEWAQQGCSVPVVINGQTNSPAVTLSIHTGGGQCVDPPVQSYGQIQLIKTIASGTASDGETDTFSAVFPSGPGLPPPQGLPSAIGSEWSGGLPPSSVVPVPGASRACAVPGYSDLSAGTIAITSGGAHPASVAIPPVDQPGGVTYQQNLPTGFIGPGVYSISSFGGLDAPIQFQGKFLVGSPIQIETAPLAPGTIISSTSPLTVSWSGGHAETLVTMWLIEGSGLAAVADYAQVDGSAGSITIGEYCTGNPVSAGGNGVVCELGALPGYNPVTVVIDVTPYPAKIVLRDAQGVTGPVEVNWDYRYVFGGLMLSN